MNKIGNFLFLISFFLAVNFFLMAQNTLPIYEKLVNSIVNSIGHEIEQELGLFYEGSGGRMPRDIEEISISFSAHRRATIKEARELHVYITEKLLDAINNNEEIRPYLREYPFSPSRVEVAIGFNNEFSNRYADGTICYTSTINGKIYYQIFDLLLDNRSNILIEPYENAIKIIRDTPLKSEEIRVHQATNYEKHLDDFLICFTKEVKKKWGLYCLGVGGKMIDGIEDLGIKFVTDKRTPLEKARKLHVEITEKLHEKINSDPFLRPYLKEFPFPIRRTKIHISFQERNGCHYEDGSVATVRQENDKIYYSTETPFRYGANPIQPVPLHEESYENAKKIVLKKS